MRLFVAAVVASCLGGCDTGQVVDLGQARDGGVPWPDVGLPDLISPDLGPPADAYWVDPGPPGPEVRMVYVVVTDRPFKPHYLGVMERAARHVQTFYRSQLGNGKTFRLRDPPVEVAYSTHDAAWFSTNPLSINDPQWLWAQNARADVMPLVGAQYDDPDFVWVFYVDSDNACGQYGGAGGNRVVVVPANDLRGLAGETPVKICPTDPGAEPVCRWVGGLGHELGHAFGLPHPPGCDAGQPSCDVSALMWAGFRSYPNTYLRADEKVVLENSPFFAPRGALPAFDCSYL